MRTRETGKEGERGLETEGNYSGTCTGNTSIFSTAPQRAKQKHELNEFGQGEWEEGGIDKAAFIFSSTAFIHS